MDCEGDARVGLSVDARRDRSLSAKASSLDGPCEGVAGLFSVSCLANIKRRFSHARAV